MKPRLISASVVWRDGARCVHLSLEVDAADAESLLDACHLEDGPDVGHIREIGQAEAKRRDEESAYAAATAPAPEPETELEQDHLPEPEALPPPPLHFGDDDHGEHDEP